jgi:flagellar hook protein FlgE
MALALFNSSESLSSVSDNLFVETADSGGPIIVEPNTLGAGRILPNSLETSNVDLAREFVDLILAQQVFEANARLVSTSDEMLEVLTLL